jgi:thioredoxin 1
MSPVINEIAAQTKGRVKVCKVDVDQCGELATKFRVTGIPNFIILKDGKEVENLVGIQSKETLVQALQKHVNLQ